MNVKAIIISSVISFIIGGVIAGTGIYIYSKNGLATAQSELSIIRESNNELRDRIDEIERISERLQVNLDRERVVTSELAGVLERVASGNLETRRIYNELAKIIDKY